MKSNDSSILITGAPRSGTTFVGKMLALPSEVVYLDEPFNTQTGLVGIDHPLMYIDDTMPEAEAKLKRLMHELLTGRGKFRASRLPSKDESAVKAAGRRLFSSRTNLEYQLKMRDPRRRRYLLKDPMACFATEFLHQKLNMQTIVILRHPASTIASYKRLGWHYSLTDLTNQPGLMQKYLDPLLGPLDLKKLSPVQEWSYFWLAVYTVLEQFIKANPKMIVVRHEDISREPLAKFEKLYAALDLNFTPRIQQKITAHTQSGNPINPPNNAAHHLRRDSARNLDRWKQILTEAEIAEIRRLTAPVADLYYPNSEW